jgi:S-adenosyl-L-methionine hydrolase (adenosine-forming)
MGVPFESVGPTIPIGDLVRLPRPTATVADGRLETQIVHVMIYGNVTFAGTPAELEAAIGPLGEGRPVRLTFGAAPGDAGGSVVEDTVWGATFGSVPLGSSVLMSDSEGHLSFADNQGDAARRLGLAVDRPVTITAR